jgi:UDP-N-acetylglucosamine:LPS N-acetylglucosamine transferase
MNQRILFFSRGKGRGHAIPDAAIATDLMAREPSVEVTFASYSTGLATLRDLGCPVIDLGLPETNPLWDTVSRVIALLREHSADLILSHEEFAAVPVAKAFGIPAVFLTDWFLDSDHLLMKSLAVADEVLFMDAPGYFDEPEYLAGKVRYVGNIFRHLERSDAQGEAKRVSLGIPRTATVISVLPGGATMHSEASAPVFDLVVDAFRNASLPDKRLMWVADRRDHEDLGKRAGLGRALILLEPHLDIASTIVASDLVITKSNRRTLLECQALGVPSISISFGLNPMDEQRIVRIPTNTALRAGGIDELILADYIVAALKSAPLLSGQTPIDTTAGRTLAVGRILEHLQRTRPS